MPTKLSVIIVAFICLIPNSSGFAQEEENEAGMESALETLLSATHDENVEVRVNAFYALEFFESSSEVLIKRIQESFTIKTRTFGQPVFKVIETIIKQGVQIK